MMTNKEITIAEVIAPHVARYNDMWQKFQSGQITTDQWVAFCRDYYGIMALYWSKKFEEVEINGTPPVKITCQS